MIQRIQTIYYLVAAICFVIITVGFSVFSFNLESEEGAKTEIEFNSYGVVGNAGFSAIDANKPEFKELTKMFNLKEGEDKVENSFPFYIISILLLLFTIGAIATFKKLPLQVRLGRFAFFFTFLLLIFVTVMYYIGGSQFTESITGGTATKSLGLSFFALVVALAFLFLGNLGVRRDIKLVQSLDRLR